MESVAGAEEAEVEVGEALLLVPAEERAAELTAVWEASVSAAGCREARLAL